CPIGTYGQNCSRSCTNCTHGSTCNNVDGACPRGCNPGYNWAANKRCNTACETGRYGYNCSSYCSIHCLNGISQCDKATGICKQGCAAGYMGRSCSTVCADGKFGPGCNLNCSGHCYNGETCTKTTGKCLYGCEAGYIGLNCSTPCPNGTFGANCSRRCHCINGTDCRNTDGFCKNGCAFGWKGHTCSEDLNIIHGIRQTVRTNQSTTLPPAANYGSSKAIDGVQSYTVDTCACCSVTYGTSPSWWQIDLRTKYLIEYVEIFGRASGNAEQLQGAKIYAGNISMAGNVTTGDFIFEVPKINDSTHFVEHMDPVIARFFVVKPLYGILTLCEFRLFKKVFEKYTSTYKEINEFFKNATGIGLDENLDFLDDELDEIEMETVNSAISSLEPTTAEPEPQDLEQPNKRFKSASESDITRLKAQNTERTTDSSTKWAVGLLKAWMSENEYLNESFEDLDPTTLDTLLQQFYACLQSRKGGNYSKSALVGIRADVKDRRYLTMAYNEADKTHHGLDNREKSKEPRMYETGDDFCPLKSFEKYLSKLHPQCERLFQRPQRVFAGPESETWNVQSLTSYIKPHDDEKHNLSNALTYKSRTSSEVKSYNPVSSVVVPEPVVEIETSEPKDQLQSLDQCSQLQVASSSSASVSSIGGKQIPGTFLFAKLVKNELIKDVMLDLDWHQSLESLNLLLQTECDVGSFGNGCSYYCHCSDMEGCNPVTGKCQNPGCFPGWQGEACDQVCDRHNFGAACKETCHCINGSSCEHTNGTCVDGKCDPGWLLPTCSAECPARRYGVNCTSTCHCLNNTGCNHVTGVCYIGYCDPGWQGDTCNEAGNILMRLKGQVNTQMSSVAHNWTSNRAIDGLVGPDPDTCHCCSGTENSKLSWWRLDLRKNVSIKSVIIYSRGAESYYQDLKGFQLFLTNNTAQDSSAINTNTNTNITGNAYEINASNTLARYVTIKRPGVLTICEVMIFEGECRLGTYGEECMKECHCADNKPCNKESGHCQTLICKTGWNGTACNQGCPQDRFGDGCKERCFCAEDTCTTTYGACPGQCRQGYHGPHCNIVLQGNGITKQSENTSNKVATIGGSVGGSVAFLIIVIAAVYLFRRYRTKL
ncbi:multiple epidermal growth factor-like domains protein 10, partial [Mercenaria mercenaria]|uniref:multiple epidermal growth factor-like domains protein 10 n=1 Tax=Mercenaria mercenaria TaxID=6596 RepID=UPI00234F6C81